MIENQTTVSTWARSTFGPAELHTIANRAEEEFYELHSAIEAKDYDSVMEELADVVIILWGIAHELDRDLQMYIDEKMKVNRLRKWKLRGDGSADHVKEEL